MRTSITVLLYRGIAEVTLMPTFLFLEAQLQHVFAVIAVHAIESQCLSIFLLYALDPHLRHR